MSINLHAGLQAGSWKQKEQEGTCEDSIVLICV
jgi:hypothetical protein